MVCLGKSRKKKKKSLTIGWDKSFVVGGETLVNVEAVRFKPDGHLVAFDGDYGVF